MTIQDNPPGGDTAGTGTNTLDVAPGFDPNASRKAILARHTALSQAEMELDHENVPGLAQMNRGYDQGETAETDDGDASDTGMQPPRETPGEIAEEPLQSAQPVVASDANEQVTLKVFGKEIIKSKAEVDAVGGVEAAQTMLAAEQRRSENRLQDAERLAQLANQLARNAADKQRELDEKLKQLGRSAPNAATPAQPNQAPAAQDPALIEKIRVGLWSGDPEQADAAIREVLATSQPSQSIDPQQIAELVQAHLDAQHAQDKAVAAQEQQRKAVNDLMLSDRFKPIMERPEIKATTQTLFNAAMADKRNQGRSWVTIADEVGSQVLGMIGATSAPPAAEVTAEVAARTNFKRRIPQPSSASNRAPTSEREAEYPVRPADVVALLREARGQPSHR